jgi:hypothetical protein
MRVPCAVGVICGRWVSLRSGRALRPSGAFRVGLRVLHRWSPVCLTHEVEIETPYQHPCGATIWGHRGTFYSSASGEIREAIEYRENGGRIVECSRCGEPLLDALPIGWEGRRRC